MKIFYFCAQTFVQYICKTKDKGKLCLLIADYNQLRRSTLVGILLCQVLILPAQQTVNDSVCVESCTFRARHLIIPSALIAIGSFGVENGWLCSIKKKAKDGFGELRGDCRFHADDYLQYLPTLANVGLGLIGAKSRHPFRERIAATATAYAVMGLIVNTTKYTIKEKRPDSEARNSFPSGHTATAFMGAELVREEYGNAYGASAYALAMGVAFLRIYNDRHWLNDVIAGAGVGILSARIGYWLLPLERHLFKWDKKAVNITIIPTYQYETRSYFLHLTTQF